MAVKRSVSTFEFLNLNPGLQSIVSLHWCRWWWWWNGQWRWRI